MPTQRQRWREQAAQRELRRAREQVRRIATVAPVALTSLVPGVVVWGRFPPVSRSRSALRCAGFRPAVVTGRTGSRISVRVVTGSSRLIGAAGYTTLEGWVDAGLDRRSAVFGFDVQVDRMEILQVLGHLGEEDRQRCLSGPAGLHAVTSHAPADRSDGSVPVSLRRSA